jgi:HD superfamily phosphohydrolase
VKKVIVPAIIVLLVTAVGILAFYLHKNKISTEEMTKLFELEKEEMENEYSGFAVQYDELQVHISNDSLIRQLEKEKIRTQQLLEELRQTKATNASEIRRLKKELATVRAVLRTYIVQIDSLDQVNKQLAQENTQVKQKYTEATKTIDNLAKEKEIAEEKVSLASQLDAAAITVTAKNKRGKTENKVKNVTKFVIDFTIVKNITTKTGEKIIYVRLVKPDGDALLKNPDDKFKYENTELGYSIKKYIEYTGEQLQVTLYWDVEEFLHAGTYNVFIFVDGVMIGEQSFTLD